MNKLLFKYVLIMFSGFKKKHMPEWKQFKERIVDLQNKVGVTSRDGTYLYIFYM